MSASDRGRATKSLGIFCFLLLLAACASEDRPPLESQSPSAQAPHARSVPAKRMTQARPRPVVQSAGPLQTAMVGAYMDSQERDFRLHLRSTGATVSRVGDDLVIAWRNDLLFSGEVLSSRGKFAIEQVSELLRHYDHSIAQVSGFSDMSGTAAEAMESSQHHAKAVADGLTADGVAAARVSFQAFGATRLKFVTGPGQSEPRNRRIEIRVIAHPQA